MNKLLTFSFIGGDMRQLRVISLLAKDGFHIRVFGFGEELKNPEKGVYLSKTVADCISGADVIVLPLPYSIDGEYINLPLSSLKVKIDDVTEAATNAIICVGKADAVIEEKCRRANLKVIDYANREEMAVMNAVPTAEGAIEVAMSNTPFTIKDSRCLVIGHGKIGKALANDLRGLGANVTVSARKYKDLAEIQTENCVAVRTAEIDKVAGEFDIIFNTVPSMVVDFKVISKTKPDVLIIDLASRPGGVDFDIAREMNRKVIWALSLPGKSAPHTAGMIIKDTLMNILEELEL